MDAVPSRPMPRDLTGYGEAPPDPRWPGGARVAVSFVLNFEEGAETSVAEGDARNEAVYEVIDRLEGRPDPCLESHFDYGTRVGWWRIMKAFDDAGARCTVSACGRAVERTPALAADAVRRGHEVSAHGWRWESHADMAESDERASIARTVAAIGRATGTRPVGWHTRSASSPNTRRLLIEEGGFLYDSDWYGDDLPTTLRFGDRRHVVLPYAFDWLWREGAHAPRMMSVGLHLRMLGRPGRMQALVDVLAEMTRRPGTWIARRDEIARHWLERGA